MDAMMIKVEPGEKMTKAVERCRTAHPRIRRVDSNTVRVITSSSTHTAKISRPRPDLVLAQCDCQAGIRSILCLHVPAALAMPAASTPARHGIEGVLIKGRGRSVQIDGWDI